MRPSTVDDYDKLPLGENRPSFESFGNFSRSTINQICAELKLDGFQKGAVEDVWSRHPNRQQPQPLGLGGSQRESERDSRKSVSFEENENIITIYHWTQPNTSMKVDLRKMLRENGNYSLEVLKSMCEDRWRGASYRIYVVKMKGSTITELRQNELTNDAEFEQALELSTNYAAFEVKTDHSSPLEAPLMKWEREDISSKESYDTGLSFDVKEIANFTCLFCGYRGNPEHLETSHLFDRYRINNISSLKKDKKARAKETKSLRHKELLKYGLNGWNSDRNMISLCIRCHKLFDAPNFAIGIDPDQLTLEISNSIKNQELTSGEDRYSSLKGKKVVFSDGEACKPPDPLLRFRYKLFLDKQATLKKGKRITHSEGEESESDISFEEDKEKQPKMKSPRKKRKPSRVVDHDQQLPQKKQNRGLTAIQMILKGAEKCLTEARTAVQRFNTRHYGVDIVETSPDGNCAIYAIQDQLQYIHHAAEFESHHQIRARINTNIRGILESLTEQQLEDIFLEARVFTINQYIARMGEDRFWLDHVAIFALAIDLNVQIEVYIPRSLRGSPPYAVYTSNAGEGRPVLRLLYNGRDHYDSIRGIPR